MIKRERELAEFIPFWVGKPQTQILTEFASYGRETRREPDSYLFVYNQEGKLISPITGRLVEDSIEKDTHLGKIEHQAFLFIESWGWENDSGDIVWISPPYPQKYPAAKIIKTKIVKEGGVKGLFNVATVLDISQDKCLKLAKSLSSNEDIDSVKELRRQPVVVDSTFESPSQNKAGHEAKIIGELFKIPEDLWIENRVSIAEAISKKARNLHFFGREPTSCLTAFSFFFENAYQIENTFTCPNCEKEIPSGLGITTCPHCGARKEDYKTCV